MLLVSGIAGAQHILLERAEEAIIDSFYERAYKLTTDAMEDEIVKKDPLTYYLRAISIYHLSKEPFFIKKNPEPIKDACKMVIKGRDKDKDKRYEGRFDEFIADLVIANNLLAEEEYKVNRYSKAIKIYTLSHSLNGDTMAFFMIGKSYQMSADTPNALHYYKRLVNMYNEDNKSGKIIENPIVDPFLFLTDYQWVKKNYDSANYYLDVARSIFGEANTKINFYQYLIAKDQITNQPPSSLMMDVIKKALVYSPSDTFFIKKENALALYLIRNAIDAGGFKDADSMIFRFARAKAIKSNDPALQSLKDIDIFLQPYSENVMWKMCDYYYVNTHDKASAYLAKIYILRTATPNDTIIPTQKDIIARWIKIVDFAAENETSGFVALLLNQALTDYPKAKELLELKKKLLVK